MFKLSNNFHRGFDEWVWVRGYEINPYRNGPILNNKEVSYWLQKEILEEK